jgi:hypothetical protein
MPSLQEVAVIDWVFMVIMKSNGLIFDKRLNGFHGFYLQVFMLDQKRGLKDFVTSDILIQHFSKWRDQ